MVQNLIFGIYFLILDFLEKSRETLNLDLFIIVKIYSRNTAKNFHLQ